jgi:AhpD family alkylhydroperoxidase
MVVCLYTNHSIMERITYKEVPAAMATALTNTQQVVEKSGLDKKLLGLIKMRVSQINDCAYCIDMHLKEGLHAGETALRLISLPAWRETPYYSAEEQAVLEFAELLTHMPAGQHSDHIHDELNKYFNKQEIAYITLAVIMINSWNRLTRSFGRVPGNYQVAAAAVTA